MRFVEAMESHDVMYGQASATLQRFGHMVDLVIERQCALGRRMYLSILGMSLLVQRSASSRPNVGFRAARTSASGPFATAARPTTVGGGVNGRRNTLIAAYAEGVLQMR